MTVHIAALPGRMPRAVQGYLVAGITTTQPEITQRDLRNRAASYQIQSYRFLLRSPNGKRIDPRERYRRFITAQEAAQAGPAVSTGDVKYE